LKELEAEIERLESEEKTWKSLLSNPLPSQTTSPSITTINPTLLSSSQQSLLSLITPQPSITAISSRLSALTSSLEPTIDSLADGVHALSQYSSAASKIASRVTGVWAARLQARDEQARQAVGTGAKVGARDVLRALAGTLNEGQ
jgi:kinetochore protein Mis13/DSN1